MIEDQKIALTEEMHSSLNFGSSVSGSHRRSTDLRGVEAMEQLSARWMPREGISTGTLAID